MEAANQQHCERNRSEEFEHLSIILSRTSTTTDVRVLSVQQAMGARTGATNTGRSVVQWGEEAENSSGLPLLLSFVIELDAFCQAAV